LPLEAQRLGLESHASDLNPVAVLINKAMIEIPPKFAGKPPINPEARKDKELIGREWKGAEGLAEDVRYYGQWMRDEAEKRIGHLYPKIKVTSEMVKGRLDLKKYAGKELTVIAWIWARTVKSPNPAYSKIDVPLASTFMLSTKAGQEAYVEPVIEKNGYHFIVKLGKPKYAEVTKNGTKLSRGANFRCLMSDTPMEPQYIKDEGKAGRMGARLMAIVAEGDKGRVYIAPIDEHEKVAGKAKPNWKPETPLAHDPRALWTPPYGLATYGDLFTNRQLVALTAFCDLVQEARKCLERDALVAGLDNDNKTLREGGTSAHAYSEAVGVYLGFIVDKCSDYWSSVCSWINTIGAMRNTFGRQAIPMVWDYAEVNCFSDSTGNWMAMAEWAWKALANVPAKPKGSVSQVDAQNQSMSSNKIISTDPPYYDNIGYADLSDFFYVWMRRSQRTTFPELFSTLAVPKAEELVATPYRHGDKEKAEQFFLSGMTLAMNRLSQQSHQGFPLTIYYAFKQSERDNDEGTTNTGWDTFLAAVIESGFSISGTWPMRTEFGNRPISDGTNALASSIVLVCHKRESSASIATRRDFISSLKKELPTALKNLQKGNIRPVDLAQASIGPGMAIYTRYAKILDADGKPLSVNMALNIINQTLDEVLEEQEGEFDADTRWAIKWFEQYGFTEGPFGDADNLARAKVTAVNGLIEAGIIKSKAGEVVLLKKDQLDKSWTPETDKRLTIWEIAHHLIRALDEGESKASDLLFRIGPIAEAAKDLSYRLHAICVNPKNKWSKEAQDYDSLVKAWTNLQTGAKEAKTNKLKQGELI
jgi:putative DNA methylase